MLLVIFGAGASYDSDPGFPPGGQPSSNESARPPLARELFSPRFGHHVRALPAAAGLLPQLRKSGDAVEQELEQIRADASRYEHLPRQLAALRCYIREVVAECDGAWWERADGLTNYSALMQWVERWRQDRLEQICLVTFNYDTLLDKACRSILPVFPLNTVASYVSDTHYKLIKLHGSVDWYRRVRSSEMPAPPAAQFTIQSNRELISIPPEQARDYFIDRAGQWTFGDEFQRSTRPETLWPFFPAIAIPTATKADSDFECPLEHLEILAALLPTVTHLLVVGWRGAEDHFYQLWRGALQSLQSSRRPPNLIAWQIVSDSEESALAVRTRLSTGIGVAGVPEARLSTGGFSKFLDSQELRDFLAAE
jgi:hypothetical protein